MQQPGLRLRSNVEIMESVLGDHTGGNGMDKGRSQVLYDGCVLWPAYPHHYPFGNGTVADLPIRQAPFSNGERKTYGRRASRGEINRNGESGRQGNDTGARLEGQLSEVPQPILRNKKKLAVSLFKTFVLLVPIIAIGAFVALSQGVEYWNYYQHKNEKTTQQLADEAYHRIRVQDVIADAEWKRVLHNQPSIYMQYNRSIR